MTRVLITGATGQIGSALIAQAPATAELFLAARSLDADQPGNCLIDLSERSLVDQMLVQVKPRVIINTAAWTNVDAAETDSDAAHIMNAELPAWLADYAGQTDTLLVHYSTDYVFDGNQSQAYMEIDQVNPQTVYGRTKLAGERAISNRQVAALILRTSWVYGGPTGNFLSTIAGKLIAGEQLHVVDDQFGCPTWSWDIAGCTWAALEKVLPVQQAFNTSIYHLAGDTAGSWYDFARQIETELAELGRLAYDPQLGSAVSPCATTKYPRPAPRPTYSVLDSGNFAKQFGRRPRGWQAVGDCLRLGNQEPLT